MMLPRPRLTVRVMMALVAMVALVFGGMRARERYVQCIAIAETYGASSRSLSVSLASASVTEKATSLVQARLLKRIASNRENSAELRAKADAVRDRGADGRLKAALYVKWASENFESGHQWERRLALGAEDLRRQERRLGVNRRLLDYLVRRKKQYEWAALRPWEPRPSGTPPSDPEYAVGFWLQRRDYDRALDECREAITVDPENPEPHNLRAWILATCPDGRFRDDRLAIKEATRACELSRWDSYPHLDTLGAAYAETGDFARAIPWEERALSMVPADDPERGAIMRRLELYKAGKPYRTDR